MPTTPGTGDTHTRSIDEQFLDVICGDADLLAAEFDAIVAAEWPTPIVPSGGDAGVGRPDREAARRTTRVGRDPTCRAWHPDVDRWTRQRSPPRTCSHCGPGRSAGTTVFSVPSQHPTDDH